MGSVDNRVVKMQFDNQQFESGVKTSLNTINDLKNGLNLDAATQSLSKLESAGKSFSLAGISSGVDTIVNKFSTLGIVGVTALQNITNAAIEAGKSIVNSVVSPIIEGGKTRALNIEQAKFQLEGLGVAWEDISDDINYGVKDTAYGLDSAAKVASQLVASNVEIGDSMKTALRAVSGVAAMTNSSYDDIGKVFTTVAGNGRLMGDQLLQLSSRGLNAAATLANYLKVSEAEVREMVSKGEIDFATFAKAMDSAFGEHAKDANKTFTGAMSNVKAALSRIGADVATPAFENLRKVFNALIPVIDKVHTSLSPMIDTLSVGMEKVSNFVIKGLENFDSAKIESVADTMNKIDELAKKVIAGEYGNGEERKKNIEALGESYEEVQSRVNEMLGGTASSTEKTGSYLSNIISNLNDSSINVGKGLLSILKPIKEALNEIFPPITIDKVAALTENVKNLTAKFKIGESTSTKLKSTFKGVFSVLSILKEAFLAVARTISPVFTRFGGLGNSLLSVTGKLGDYISGVNETIKKNDTFYKALQKLVGFIKTGFGVAKEKVKILVGMFEEFTGIDLRVPTLEDFYTVLGWIKNRISSLPDLFEKAKDSISGFFESFSKKDSGETENNFSTMETISTVFANLSNVLSRVSPRIGAALSGISEAFGETFSKIDFERFYKLVNVGFLIAILMAVNKLSSIISTIFSFGRVFHNLNGFIVSARGALTAFANDIKAKTFLKIAGAIAILAASLIALSMVDEKKLTSALGAMAGLFLQLFGSIIILDKVTAGAGVKGLFATANGMVLISVAMSVLTAVLKKLAQIDPADLAKGLITMSVALAAITVAVRFMPSNMPILGAGLISVAIALNILTGAINSLGECDILNLVKGVLSMAVALAAITVAVRFMPATLPLIGVGLMLITNAIVVLTGALKILGSMNISEIGKSLLILASSLAAIVIAANLMKSAIPGAVAISIISGALAVLCPVLVALGKLDLSEIGKSLLILAGSFVIIGVAGALLSPILPAILGLAGAITLLGIGALAAGAGIAVLAVGITTLIASISAITALGNSLFYAISIIVDALTVLVISILSSLETIVPKAFEVGWKLLLNFLYGIANNIGSVVDAASMIIVNLLRGLESRMDDIMIVGLSIIVKFINGIATMLEPLVQAGINLMIKFIDGMADGIRNNTDSLFSALNNLMSSIVEFVLSALQQLVRNIPVIGNELYDGLEDAKESVREAFSTEEMHTIGYNAASATANGIKDANEEVQSAGTDLGTSAKSGLSSVLGDFSTLGSDFGIDFTSGLGSTNDIATTAGSNLGTSATSGLSSVMGDFSSLGNSFGTDFTSALGGTNDIASTAGSDLGTSATSGLTSTLGDFSSLGDDFGTDFANSLGDTEGLVSTAASDLGTSATSGLDIDLTSIGESAGDEYSSGLSNTESDVKNSATGIASTATESLTKANDAFEKSGSTNGAKYASGLSSKKTAAKNAGSQLSSSGVNGVSSSVGRFREVGENSGEGFVAGINSATGAAQYAAANLARIALESMNAALGIHSPSKEFAKAGMYSDEGLAIGLSKFAGVVDKSAQDVGETALSALKDTMSIVSDIINGDINIDPTIRPVLDLSAVSNGAKQINGLFTQPSLSLANNAGRIAGSDLNNLASTIAAMQKGNNSGSSEIIDVISQLRGDVASLGEAISKMQIKMDTGALVGSIADPMDMALGQRMNRKGRGN